MDRLNSGHRLPHDEDLQGAAVALVRLQHAYNLNLSRMAQEELWGVATKAGETPMRSPSDQM